jgi:hypothetical protein
MTSPGRPGGLHPTPERVRLANGLTAVLQPHDGAEVAAVQLWVRAGARDERPDEAGLSHFIEHLLFKGTPSRGPGVIDQTISGLGGEMNAATSQDWTYFHVVLPAAPRDGARHPRRRGPARRIRPGRGRARATRGPGGDLAAPRTRPARFSGGCCPAATSASTRTGGRCLAPPRPSPACRTRRSSTTSAARTCQTTRRWWSPGACPWPRASRP